MEYEQRFPPILHNVRKPLQRPTFRLASQRATSLTAGSTAFIDSSLFVLSESPGCRGHTRYLDALQFDGPRLIASGTNNVVVLHDFGGAGA